MKKGKTKLIVGCFYHVFNGPPHPALIFKYDPKHKTYFSIKFGTTKGKHMTRIHPIQDGYTEAYAHNRPFEGTRDDYGDRELVGIRLDERDVNIINLIKNETPKQSRRAKKRYKRSKK